MPDLKIAVQHVSVNSQDDDLMTPLHHAAGALALEATDFLLSVEGIDPTLVDRFNRTAAEVPFDVWKNLGDAMTDKLTPICHPALSQE